MTNPDPYIGRRIRINDIWYAITQRVMRFGREEVYVLDSNSASLYLNSAALAEFAKHSELDQHTDHPSLFD